MAKADIDFEKELWDAAPRYREIARYRTIARYRAIASRGKENKILEYEPKL